MSLARPGLDEKHCLSLSSSHQSSATSVTIFFSSPRSRRTSDSPVHFPQRKPSPHRESPPFSRPGRPHLRLGHFHHCAHLPRRSFRLRAPLAPPRERRGHHPPAYGPHRRETPRASQ